jgi:NADH-quinone oxidoreductase subunit J
MTTFFLVALFGAVAVLFAVLVVATRQPMRAALALVAHMISLAAIYAVLDVHVVALFQVLVYVGAVMVFMVYTIMLLDDRDPSYTQPYTHPVLAAFVALVVGVALLWVMGSPTATGVNAPEPVAGLFGFRGFALGFMKQYVWHFELATVLLLVGIVAAWTTVREALRGEHA